jgi:hypothetical protein
MKRFFVSSAALVVALVATNNIHAAYNFSNISNNSGLASTVASQFLLEVSDAGSNRVSFKISNTGSMASTIGEIYVDTTPESPSILTNIYSLTQSSGVSYTAGSANPGNLPGGNTVSPAFVVTPGLLVDNNPGNAKGIDPGEWLIITFNLRSGATFDDVLAALNGGADGKGDDIRVGLHVRSINGGTSDGFVNTTGGNSSQGDPIHAPAPPAILLLGLGAALMGIPQLKRSLRNRLA